MADFVAAMSAADEVIGHIKKHASSGLPPTPVKVSATTDDGQVKLTWTGADTVVDGQTLCTLKGVMIRRGTSEYPRSLTDGTLVASVDAQSGSYTDTGLTNGVEYKYTLFPYSDHGVYYLGDECTIAATPKSYTLYQYYITDAESNPSSRVVYEGSTVGMTPATMSGGTFDPGSWTNKVFFRKNNHAYMVKYDGTIDYQLDDSDYSKKATGGSSDVANTGYGGNVMARLDTVWVKITKSGDIIHVCLSDKQLDDGYTAIAHTREDGTVMSYIMMSCYPGTVISDKLRSISGQTPTGNQTYNAFVTKATANGSCWYIRTLGQRILINLLLTLMFKTTDLQSALGKGREGSNDSANKNGLLDTKGAFWGNQTQTSSVKAFHIENLWGNIGDFTAGLLSNSSGNIKYRLKKPYNTTGSGYTTMSTISSTQSGYVSKMQTKDNALLPSAYSGSTSTYYADYTYEYKPSSGVFVPYWGGYWFQDAGLSGPWYFNLNYDPGSSSLSLYGAALSLEPADA